MVGADRGSVLRFGSGINLRSQLSTNMYLKHDLLGIANDGDLHSRRIRLQSDLLETQIPHQRRWAVTRRDNRMTCQCPSPGFCPTLGRTMPTRLHQLCQTRRDYRQLSAGKQACPMKTPESSFRKSRFAFIAGRCLGR